MVLKKWNLMLIHPRNDSSSQTDSQYNGYTSATEVLGNQLCILFTNTNKYLFLQHVFLAILIQQVLLFNYYPLHSFNLMNLLKLLRGSTDRIQQSQKFFRGYRRSHSTKPSLMPLVCSDTEK